MPLAMPRYAADCHEHVFDPDYPFAEGVHYIPEYAQRGTADDFAAVLDSHGFTHGLLVGAVPYAGDNSAMLAAIAKHKNRYKGIALIRDSEITDKKIKQFADGGVVGLRVNLMSFGTKEITGAKGEKLLATVKEMNWLLQLHLHEADLVEAAPILRKAGVRLMFDHFGRPDVDQGIDQPGFKEMLEFGREGNSVIKLSGPFRSSKTGYPFEDTDRFIEASIEAFGIDNCVWGSDWPFVRVEKRIDYGPQLVVIPRWFPTEADRQKVLWDNPKRLFGFVEY